MTSFRWLVLGAVLGFSASLASCGTGKKCTAVTCQFGCCDAAGTCQNGSSNAQCGSQGAACQPCSIGQVCQLGVCALNGAGGGTGGANGGGTGGANGGGTGGANGGGTATGGGGGTTTGGGGGTGGGSATCNTSNCNGCCRSNGSCVPGTTSISSSTACGLQGRACVDCAALNGGICNNGTCFSGTGGGGPTGGGGGTTPSCTFTTTNFGNKGQLSGTAHFAPDDAGMGAQDSIVFTGALSAGIPHDRLELQLLAGYGVFTNGIAPGTYPITGAELNYATCGVCVLVDTQYDGGDFTDTYLATGGTVTVSQVGTAWGQTLSASMSNVTFEHVTIASGTFTSTPVNDGCFTALGSASINAPLVP